MIRSLVIFAIVCIGLALTLPVTAKETPYQYSAPEIHSGQTIKLTNFKGKLIYLDFWASWCAPCRQSFPFMESLHQEFRSKGLRIIAINIDEDKLQAKDFLKQHPVSFINLYDPQGKIGKPMKVKRMPTSFLIDPKGNILFKHSGFNKDYAVAVRAAIKKQLDQP